MKKFWAACTAVILAAGAVILGVAAPASAHTPVASATCEVLTVNLTQYAAIVPGKDATTKTVYQRYSWNGGTSETAPTEVPPSDNWQANTSNYHKGEILNAPYQGNGNSDWFFWTSTEVPDKAAVAAKVNTVTVFINDVQVDAQSFGTSFANTYTFSDKTVANTWKVVIDAHDGTAYDKTLTGTSTPCVAPVVPSASASVTGVATCDAASSTYTINWTGKVTGVFDGYVAQRVKYTGSIPPALVQDGVAPGTDFTFTTTVPGDSTSASAPFHVHLTKAAAGVDSLNTTASGTVTLAGDCAPVVVPPIVHPTVTITQTCGVATVVFTNGTPYAFAGDVRVDNEAPSQVNYYGLGDFYQIVNIPANGSITKTYTFAEDSGDHTVAARIGLGAESDWFVPWKIETITSDCVPPVIQQCEVITNGGVATNLNLDGWDFSQTRATGHNDFVDGGLHVWTESNGTTDKAAGYHALSIPLAEVGAPSITLENASGVLPSIQLGVDRDGNGTWDGYLVNEGDIYGAGNWWTSKTGFGVPAGGGYASLGTLNEYLAANPDARVVSFGYSLGSGVKGDAVIKQITVGCATYTFDHEEEVVIPTKPEPVTESKSESVTDCKAGTVTTTEYTRTTGEPTYNEETNTWTQGEFDDWAAGESVVRDATEEECPTPVVVKELPTPPALAHTGADGGLIAGGIIGGFALLMSGAAMLLWRRKLV